MEGSSGPRALPAGDVNKLVRSLGKGRCVLFLGAGLDVQIRGERYNLADRLSRVLARQLYEEYEEEVAETSDLPHVAQRLVYHQNSSPAVLRAAVIDFYEEHRDESNDDPVLAGLAELPFRLVLTNRHDRTFERYLEARGKNPRVHVYRRDEGVSKVPDGTVLAPVIYYLGGDLEHPHSLIISDHDVLEFLGAVVSRNPGLPKSISAKVSDPSTMLLLAGFQVRKCYTRLLLSALGRDDQTHPSVAFGESDSVRRAADTGAEQFFHNEFRIITHHSDTEHVVADLVSKWKEADSPLPPDMGEPQESFSRTPARVFISYCRGDADAAGALFRAMQDENLDPFLDEENIEGGDVWESRIQEEIEKADYFVILLSEQLRLKGKSVVHEELELATKEASRWGDHKFILPVAIDDTTYMPRSVRKYDVTKVSSDADREKLVSTILRDHQERDVL